MLDRTKLKRIGIKRHRRIIDDEYAEMLVGKCLLLGCKLKRRSQGEVVVAPLDLPQPKMQSRLLWRHSERGPWYVHTKSMHDFLTFWSNYYERETTD